MFNQLLSVFVLASLLTLKISASEFVIPEAGEDLKVTEGLSAKEFFGKRAQPSECRRNWEAAWNQYLGLRKEINALVKGQAPANEIDAKESEVIRFRKSELFELTEECGPCATQEVIKKEEWHVTDGSCFFPTQDSALLNQGFNNAKGLLSNSKLFARHRGGFGSILEFVPVNRLTGAFLPHAENMMPGSKVDTFIAVRGPIGIAFNYIFENRIELRESPNGVREFIVRFTGLPRPSGFKPRIYDTTLAGTKKEISFAWDLSRVVGMWYVRNDGYYRYFTAADFELPLSVGTAFARTTLLDTVLTLAERGL